MDNNAFPGHGQLTPDQEKIRTLRQENKQLKLERDILRTDISSATLIRPAQDALRDKAFQGQINKIIVFSPDRLTRTSVHQLVLIEEFSKLSVDIIFSNRGITATPENQFLLQIQGIISEYEREKIMERNRRGKLCP
ncbi:MAG: recombinase family protein [Gammaproteobacteria bacterium]|nr:recombinase family protein [Gammaproteobacteria bacterium]